MEQEERECMYSGGRLRRGKRMKKKCDRRKREFVNIGEISKREKRMRKMGTRPKKGVCEKRKGFKKGEKSGRKKMENGDKGTCFDARRREGGRGGRGREETKRKRR